MPARPSFSEPTGLRPRVSNEGWDVQRMLRRAIAADYPSAKNPATRQDEIAYWRARAQHEATDTEWQDEHPDA